MMTTQNNILFNYQMLKADPLTKPYYFNSNEYSTKLIFFLLLIVVETKKK